MRYRPRSRPLSTASFLISFFAQRSGQRTLKRKGSAITAETVALSEYRVRDPSLPIARERWAAMSALFPKADIVNTVGMPALGHFQTCQLEDVGRCSGPVCSIGSD